MIIPNYEIIEKMSESQQAVIFRAYHKKNPGRMLVLKILKGTLLSEYKMSQFAQKVEHLKVLNDPLVITPLLFSAKGGTCFITQEYFEGVTLDTWINERSETSLDGFFRVAIGIASALQKVHAAGIIHGGIKPHNIQIGRAHV